MSLGEYKFKLMTELCTISESNCNAKESPKQNIWSFIIIPINHRPITILGCFQITAILLLNYHNAINAVIVAISEWFL